MRKKGSLMIAALFTAVLALAWTPGTALCQSDAGSAYAYGDIVTLGRYEQDGNTKNGKEPITWIVLDKNDKGQYLVISEKVLDVKPYNPTKYPDEAKWDESTIRSWLNGYGASSNKVHKNFKGKGFLDSAFTAKEKAQIVKTPISASRVFIADDGKTPDWADKIFLLTDSGFKSYFTSDEYARADATRYAVKQGAPVFGSESGALSNNGSCTDEHCYAKWWLWSANYPTCTDCKPNTKAHPIQASHRYVDVKDGHTYMNNAANSTPLGIRPVMWVQL